MHKAGTISAAFKVILTLAIASALTATTLSRGVRTISAPSNKFKSQSNQRNFPNRNKDSAGTDTVLHCKSRNFPNSSQMSNQQNMLITL